MKRVATLIIMGGLCLSGCMKTFSVPMQHVVMYDSDGTALNPIGNDGPDRHSHFRSYDRYDEEQYQHHINTILKGIDQAEPSRQRKLMIFIHGGMNTQVESLERLYDPFDPQEKKSRVELIKEAGYYPIFINWKSSLWSSYVEHLLRIRQGQRWSRWAGWPSALVVFPIDVTRSLVRAPLAWGIQAHNDFLTVENLVNQFEPTLSDEVSKEFLCRYNLQGPLPDCVKDLYFQKPPYCVPWAIEAKPYACRPPTRPIATDTFAIAVGEDNRRCGEMNGHFASYLLTLPTKLVIGPVLDTFGTSAWKNMQRRIHLLFHSEQEQVSSTLIEKAKEQHKLALLPASGGLSVFVQQLKDHMKGRDWEVVLVGHSMGTILINELLRLFGDEDLSVSHIVYLAGAASIRDYEDSVFPYLKSHPKTQFYNFTLHAISEGSEIQYSFLDLTPRGSLLVWLDSFLADPQTMRDRTVGRYSNFVTTMHDTPISLRGQIHFRSFSAGINVEHDNPQSHHEVVERMRFWKAKCWEVDAPLDQCIRAK